MKRYQPIAKLVLVGILLAACNAAPRTTPSAAIAPTHTIATAIPTVPFTTTATSATTPTNMNTLTQQLIVAAEADNVPSIKRLLAQGANINKQDARGRTPVMAATQANQVNAVRALIEAGADINIRDNRNDNPFLYAGAEGLLNILKLTIAAGADTKLTNRFGGTALIPACERGHVEVVTELLTHTDVDVNHVNNLGWTALLEAIILSDGGPRHQQIVRLLLAHGADITIADKDGVTPLQHANLRGFHVIEQILVQHRSK